MGRRVSPDKEVERLARLARRQGWSVASTNAGHVKWTAPDGRVLFTGSTISSQRRRRGVQRELVALGFQVG